MATELRALPTSPACSHLVQLVETAMNAVSSCFRLAIVVEKKGSV